MASLGCTLSLTLPFHGNPYDVVPTLPSIAEAQVLHYGSVGVPYLGAVVPIERQEAQRSSSGQPSTSSSARPSSLDSERSVFPTDSVFSATSCATSSTGRPRNSSQAEREAESVVSHAVLYRRATLLQVSDYGQDPCGRVALGLGTDLFGRERCVGSVGP